MTARRLRPRLIDLLLFALWAALAVLSFSGLVEAARETNATHGGPPWLAWVWAAAIDVLWTSAILAVRRARPKRRWAAVLVLLIGLAASMMQVWYPPTWAARVVVPVGLLLAVLLEVYVVARSTGEPVTERPAGDRAVRAAATAGMVGALLGGSARALRAGLRGDPAASAHPEDPDGARDTARPAQMPAHAAALQPRVSRAGVARRAVRGITPARSARLEEIARGAAPVNVRGLAREWGVAPSTLRDHIRRIKAEAASGAADNGTPVAAGEEAG